MAVGGTTETTQNKMYSLMSPVVHITEKMFLEFDAMLLWEEAPWINHPTGLYLTLASASVQGREEETFFEVRQEALCK